MPEIGEVARVVHFIRKNLAGKTLAKVTAQVDENIFGKVGTSGDELMKALTGKKVLDAKQQGKYFWMVMSSPPHPLMHFGMAGWFKFRNEETFYYRPSKDEDPEWPPKYWKFSVETAEDPKIEAAFVDKRRFGRIRLINCAAEEIRNVSPLVENGPDPIIDRDVLTEEWLADKLSSKKVPIKALLLDQANISGIGNWVGDEVLYDAKIHPEQYSNTLSPSQIKQLHKSIHYVCGFAVEHLADSSEFPEEWLFKHRWGKGKKDSSTKLPNGLNFKYLTVGGRTSCVVPSVQKKTGPVAKDIDDAAEDDEDGNNLEEAKPKKGRKAPKLKNEDEDEQVKEPASKNSRSKKRAAKVEQQVNGDNSADEDSKTEDPPKLPPRKKQKSSIKTEHESENSEPKHAKKGKPEAKGLKAKPDNEKSGRRRSARVSAST